MIRVILDSKIKKTKSKIFLFWNNKLQKFTKMKLNRKNNNFTGHKFNIWKTWQNKILLTDEIKFMCKYFSFWQGLLSEFPPPKFYWSRIFKTVLLWSGVSVKVLCLDPVLRVPCLNLSSFMDLCWDRWRWNI